MSTAEKRAYDAVMKLPQRSRKRLISKLQESLEMTDALKEAIDEADAEYRSYLQGKTKAIPAEQIYPRLKRKGK